VEPFVSAQSASHRVPPEFQRLQLCYAPSLSDGKWLGEKSQYLIRAAASDPGGSEAEWVTGNGGEQGRANAALTWYGIWVNRILRRMLEGRGVLTWFREAARHLAIRQQQTRVRRTGDRPVDGLCGPRRPTRVRVRKHSVSAYLVPTFAIS
jgi:hypothetical protein